MFSNKRKNQIIKFNKCLIYCLMNRKKINNKNNDKYNIDEITNFTKNFL